MAVLSLLMLPGAAWALCDLGIAFSHKRDLYLPFLGGFAAYVLVWRLFLRHPAWGSLLSTFEHELTHAVFAWATLHPVVDFKATWRSGGHVKIRGQGNWLIAIAPYFFPTAAVAVALALMWLPPALLSWTNALLGATIAYHVISTWKETHRRQPDLHKTGFVFAWLFLPGANLLSYGLVLAFAFGGPDATPKFIDAVYDRSAEILRLGWRARDARSGAGTMRMGQSASDFERNRVPGPRRSW